MSSASGSGTGNFLQVVAKNFDVLAGPIVGLAYPVYASIRAIETKNSQDDRQWLTYWILYSMITLFELTFARLIEWIPLWSLVKLILTCWLVVPQFSGASYVYDNFVKPIYVSPPTFNTRNWYPNVPRRNMFHRPDEDILTAAEKYIEQNGTEAFEKLISKQADHKKSEVKSSSYKFYEGDYNDQNSYYYDDSNVQNSTYYDDYSEQKPYYYDNYDDQKAYYYNDYKAHY